MPPRGSKSQAQGARPQQQGRGYKDQQERDGTLPEIITTLHISEPELQICDYEW